MNKNPPGYRQWLRKPVTELRLSIEFIKAVTVRGFKTLEEIIYFPLKELVKKKWFTGSLLIELSEIVDHYQRKFRSIKGKPSSKRNTGK